MRVIGVDPGTNVTGFGIVEKNSGNFRFIAAGVIHARPRTALCDRLHAIFERLGASIAEHSPDVMSLERNFVGENVQSAFRLGEARGVAMLAAAQGGIEVFEYDPTRVKFTVASYGRADKSQVKLMVRKTLLLDDDHQLADDASDALALAICHLSNASMPMGQAGRSWRSIAAARR